MKATIVLKTGKRTASFSGTVSELTAFWGIKLKEGASLASRDGNKPVNAAPATHAELVEALNNADFNISRGRDINEYSVG